MEHTTIAVDLAKSVFQIAVSHRAGHVAEERRLPRNRFLEFFAQRPPAVIVLEACGSAHHWARQLQPFGHSVQLIAPHDVRPYVRRNKTDRTDAKGLLEAHRNTEIHPVPVKTVTHQAIASLHVMRATWMATRTARLNTLRGVLREFGLFIPVGSHHVLTQVRAHVTDDTLPALLHPMLLATCDEVHTLETQIRAVERQLTHVAADTPEIALLQTIPGIGLLTATALLAHVTEIHRFPSARRFASYLGLTPREDSTGLRRRLGAISKRGDVYLRMLLTHGARSILWHARTARTASPLQRWAHTLEQRRGHNIAAVAVANKLARLAWAVWAHQRPYVTSDH